MLNKKFSKAYVLLKSFISWCDAWDSFHTDPGSESSVGVTDGARPPPPQTQTRNHRRSFGHGALGWEWPKFTLWANKVI